MKSARPKGDKRRRRIRAARNIVRLAALLAGGIVGAFLLFQVVAKIIYPYKLGYQEAKKMAAQQSRLKRQEARNALLEKRVAFLRTPEGSEYLVRRAGYHLPGETVYLLPKSFDSASLTTPVDAPPAPASQGKP